MQVESAGPRATYPQLTRYTPFEPPSAAQLNQEPTAETSDSSVSLACCNRTSHRLRNRKIYEREYITESTQNGKP